MDIYKKNLFVHNITALFLILDALYLILYCVVIVVAIVGGNQAVKTKGFLTLGAPHISIIPTLMTILSSVRRALADNKRGLLTRLNVDSGWFLMPVLSLPYNILEIVQSFYTETFFLEGTIIFCYELSMSLIISAWMIWLFVSENKKHLEAVLLGSELADGGGSAPSTPGRLRRKL